MAELELPPAVEVSDPALDVDDLARRFRAFEALHDGLEICVPATAAELAATVDALAIRQGADVLDVACGHGGLLWRMAERSDSVTGIDLSPWALRRAVGALEARRLRARLMLGDAGHMPPTSSWDRIACIGASWIFHGPAGTWRSLARRLRAGGRIAVGDLRPRPGAQVSGVPTAEDLYRLIAELGGQIVADIVSPDEAWDAYGRAVMTAADRHYRRQPDDPAADQRAVARAWVDDATRDRASLEFAIVVARFPAP